MTIDEKLAALERCIEDFRWARGGPDSPERQTYDALKELSAELRARRGRAPSVAAVELERIITSAKVSRLAGGHVRRLAEEVIGRWHTIRQALDRYQELEEAQR